MKNAAVPQQEFGIFSYCFVPKFHLALKFSVANTALPSNLNHWLTFKRKMNLKLNMGKPATNEMLSRAREQQLIQEIAACVQPLDLSGAQHRYDLLKSMTNNAALLAHAQFSLGIIEQRSGNPAAAIALYTSALTADRRNPQLTLQLGLAHFALAQIDEAERCYRAAIKLEPRLAHAHYNLGVLLQQKNDLSAACRAFEAALSRQPRFPEALNNLGNVLAALREFPRAEKSYRDAIAINENFYFAHHGLGVLLIAQNRRSEALISLRTALKLNASNPDVWLELAECERQNGDLDAAKKSVDAALAQDPQHTVANFRRALYAGEQVESIPPEFVTRMYANMSATFDEHLVDRLGYRTPAHIKAALAPWLNQFGAAHAAKPRVIDLGCGTGLFGIQIRESAAHLVGVDLSGEMLNAARARNVYDQLFERDATSFLNDLKESADLITATDVLIYVGDLAPLFTAVATRLTAGGAFAFSIETPADLATGFRIQATGRFAHSAQYVETLAATHSLRVIASEKTVIRSEEAQPVNGYLFVLEKIAKP
jgi:predicted TPR repeat methyltransferase